MQSPAGAVQILEDVTGRRPRRVLGMLIGLVLTLGLLEVNMLPLAVAPLHQVATNKSQNFPHDLVAGLGTEAIPVIGEGWQAPFTREAVVRREGDQWYLANPFNYRIFRPVLDWEKEEIGDHNLVMERFGTMPDKALALTFDDGPDGRYTPQILDLLSRKGVQATFFVTGANVTKHPGIFRRIIREGHMAGNHTWSHTDFSGSDESDRSELTRTDRVMRALGYATSIWRMPYGDPERRPLPVLQGQQLQYLQADFSLDTQDYTYSAGQEVPVPELDGSGQVVLLHDSGGDRTPTIAMLERFIDEAQAQGYSFMTLAPLLPETYQPVTAYQPSMADLLSFGLAWSVLVLPELLLYWLTVLAVFTLSCFTCLNIVLAGLNVYRQSRQPEWQGVMMPTVSVLIAAYNEAPVIRRTLDRLRASSYPLLEVIVVENASTDGTLGILRNYAATWPVLRVIHLDTPGKANAIRSGLRAVRGDILVSLDADTLFEPQTVAKLVQPFVDPRVGVTGGNIKVGNRINLLTWWQSLEYIAGICVDRNAQAFWGKVTIVPGACSAYRMRAIRFVGGVDDDTLAEDADLALRIQRSGFRAAQVNSAVAWTEAPDSVRDFRKQRKRWGHGIIQALWKHRGMLFRPRYGWWMSFVVLPYAWMQILVPMVFWPAMVWAFWMSLSNGNWRSIVFFALFVFATLAVVSMTAVIMLREDPRHLAVVPVYRLIYEPLRLYLLVVSTLLIVSGRRLGWMKFVRKNSVQMPAALANP